MELNGKVANFEHKNLFDTQFYEIFVFKVWYFASWLHLNRKFLDFLETIGPNSKSKGWGNFFDF